MTIINQCATPLLCIIMNRNSATCALFYRQPTCDLDFKVDATGTHACVAEKYKDLFTFQNGENVKQYLCGRWLISQWTLYPSKLQLSELLFGFPPERWRVLAWSFLWLVNLLSTLIILLGHPIICLFPSLLLRVGQSAMEIGARILTPQGGHGVLQFL